ALPSRLLAEGGAKLAQPRICRRCAQRAAGAALVAWVLHVVVGRIHLDGARQRVVAAHVVAAEATRVHLPGVDLGPAIDDPLGDQPAHAAGSREPVRAEASRDPETAHLRRAEDALAGGR